MAVPSEVRPHLDLLDAVVVIVGITVGVGIFETAPVVAGCAGSVVVLLSLWALGGLLSLCGALTWAELATAWPRRGGEVVYLERAYGPWAGFLAGWAQAVVVRPGSVAAMAFPAARYGAVALGLDPTASAVPLALAAVILVTALNAAGLRTGPRAGRVVTAAKVLGLGAVVLCGAAALALGAGPPPSPEDGGPADLVLALILVLFTFGGWNEVAYVAAEVDEPSRNLFRSLTVGVGLVTLLYLAVNGAYLGALGLAGTAASKAVAAETVAAVVPGGAASAVAALVCLSALGAVNGLVFTGARVGAALGERHGWFAPLAASSPRTGVPAAALVVQGMLACLIVVLTGTFTGVVVYTTTVVWLVFLGAGLALFVLRRTEPDAPRPRPVPLYPLTPVVFCLSCVVLVHGAAVYDPRGTLVSLAVVALGLPLWWARPRT